jgi:hypothetical protein
MTIDGSFHNSPQRLLHNGNSPHSFLYSNPSFYLQTSFLRSSVNEEPATLPESPATCYKECLTPERRAKKVKNLSSKKVTNSVEGCFAEYCDATSRSIQETECTSKCASEFGKGVGSAVKKAINSCESNCQKSCSSSDEDESGSNDDCKKDCKKECEKGDIDKSTAKKTEKNINKTYVNGDECLEACFPAPAAAPTDYETLKIA